MHFYRAFRGEKDKEKYITIFVNFHTFFKYKNFLFGK